MSDVRIEFTVEPFVDGAPGLHVRAAWEAARRRAGALENGPFSAHVVVPRADAPSVVSDVVAAALANGATHVSLQVDPA
jgi:hypothetical protein